MSASQDDVVSIEKAREGARRKARQAASQAYPRDTSPSHEGTGWEDVLEQAGYSDAKFYTATSYGDSGSSQQRSVVSNQLLYAMDAIVQQGRFPYYQTRQDLIRDAIYHRLQWLNDRHDLGPKTSQALSIMAYEQEIIWRRDAMESMDRIIESSEALIEESVKRGDWETLEGFVQSAEEQLNNLREPYLSRLTQLIETASAELRVHRMAQRRRKEGNKDGDDEA